MSDTSNETNRRDALYWYHEIVRLEQELQRAHRPIWRRPPNDSEQKQIERIYGQLATAARAYSEVWEFGPVQKYQCPCCGLRTLNRPPPGTYEVCPVCWWEDDPEQFADPDLRGGANVESLHECREAFRRRELNRDS
jgi:rubrerythrin